jgi:Na+-driven multidrug efflux pump
MEEPLKAKSSKKQEAIELLRLGVPMMAMSFLSFSLAPVGTMMLGNLGTDELAASALGYTLFAAIVYPLGDLTSALETYLAQV